MCDYEIIEHSARLTEVVAHMRAGDEVALDTEFVWDRTYYPRLGLVQAAVPDGTCYLLDTVALQDLSPFGSVLADPDITKVLHDAQQDLSILHRATGAIPCSVFDTRAAAGFAGISHLLSLQALVEEVCGVSLEKGQTRTDWMKRPLSAAQLRYAAEDVLYLLAVRREICARAQERGVAHWMEEEFASLDDASLYEEGAPHEYFMRVGAASSLNPTKLSVLREVAAWREMRARRVDRPRRWIIDDRVMLEIVNRMPQSCDELARCEGLSSRTCESQADALLGAVKRGLARPATDLPRPESRGNIRKAGRERVESVLAHIRKASEAVGIDPPLVATKSEIATLLLDAPPQPDRHRILRGWRAELLGDALGEFVCS